MRYFGKSSPLHPSTTEQIPRFFRCNDYSRLGQHIALQLLLQCCGGEKPVWITWVWCLAHMSLCVYVKNLIHKCCVRLSHPFPSYSELLAWFIQVNAKASLSVPGRKPSNTLFSCPCFSLEDPKIESLNRHFSKYHEFRRHGRMFEQRKYNRYPMEIFMPQNPLRENHQRSIVCR